MGELRHDLREAGKHAARSVTPRRVRRFFGELGPGLITGAADDDPSGISTYSVTGASFGYAPLWTALFSFPLMVSVQLMCARLGMVTGRGLAGVIRRTYPPWVLWAACLLLIVANVVNIGADLGGMAEATEMVTGVNSLVWTPIYAALIISLLFWTSYSFIARVFKWLTLTLFAYVIAAFLARGITRHVCPTRRMVQCIYRYLRWHSRNNDLALPFLLGGLSGGGRGTEIGPGDSGRA
jgi:NRAMP (natural resistance-associated macrophage protein)-like metal ion transporter